MYLLAETCKLHAHFKGVDVIPVSRVKFRLQALGTVSFLFYKINCFFYYYYSFQLYPEIYIRQR